MTGVTSNPQGIPKGTQLGYLEYEVTAEKLDVFRRAVDYSQANYPNLVAGECREVLAQKMNLTMLDSVTHCDRYYRPPVVGRRVQVTGWVREHYPFRGAERLVIETFAVDDIGTEILRSLHTFQVGAARAAGRLGRRPSQNRNSARVAVLEPVQKRISEETIEQLERASRLILDRNSSTDGQSSSVHSGAQLASDMGLAAGVAPGALGHAYLHELLDRAFDLDFRQGGSLTLNFRRPIYAGDSVTARGNVVTHTISGDRVNYNLEVWLENGRGETAIEGTAKVTVPSPLT